MKVVPSLSLRFLFILFILGLILYAVATNNPHKRNTPKYVFAKFGAGVASVTAGMIALRFTGTDNFFGLAAALLLGQILFKVFENRCDRLAGVYC